ncbi:hypothetical protein [Pseudomonas fulva]|nr:hypothetical protein [Pseudomonas fulva]
MTTRNKAGVYGNGIPAFFCPANNKKSQTIVFKGKIKTGTPNALSLAQQQ